MPADTIDRLLREDFQRLAARLAEDAFAERLLKRLSQGRGLRFAALGAAGLTGAGLAGAQFAKMAGLIAGAPAMEAMAARPEIQVLASGLGPHLLAAAGIAAAFAVTAAVLQAEQ